MVYHVREPSEQPKLQELIATSVQSAEHKQEEETMRRTIADELREEGMKAGELRTLRETLLLLLSDRFRRIPSETARRVEAATDAEQLKKWLRAFATADTLDEVGIGPTK